MSVFIIINEWTTVDGDTTSGIVDSTYFRSESDAWDALKLIADAYDATLPPDSTSFEMDAPSPRIDFEEYYIQELTASA